VTKVESEEFLSLFLFPVSPLILDAPPSISETKLGSAPKIYNALNRDQLSDHEWVIPDGSENSPEDTRAIMIPLGTQKGVIKFIFISYIQKIWNSPEDGFAAPGK